MSTGAECSFYETTPRAWFYDLQCYPYGDNEEYETSGPFSTFAAAYRHLHKNNANPGSFSRAPLPGCKHDLLTTYPRTNNATCDRCGRSLSAAEIATSGATTKPAKDEDYDADDDWGDEDEDEDDEEDA